SPTCPIVPSLFDPEDGIEPEPSDISQGGVLNASAGPRPATTMGGCYLQGHGRFRCSCWAYRVGGQAAGNSAATSARSYHRYFLVDRGSGGSRASPRPSVKPSL